jgi:hypothetical protein
LRFGWSNALLILALFALLIAALAFGLREPGFGGNAGARPSATNQWPGRPAKPGPPQLCAAGGLLCLRLSGDVHRRAHAQLSELWAWPPVASYSLALVGLFNIFGTYLAGNLGQSPSAICCRASTACARWHRGLLLAPLSPWSVYASAPPWAFCGCPPCR